VSIGVRPEGLVPVTDGQPGIRVVVDVVEELGSDTYVYTSTTDDSPRVVTVRRDASSCHEPGETLTLQPALRSLHLFDATSGARLPDAPPVP
jgi:multiple sugar transport system ATP-binding protein